MVKGKGVQDVRNLLQDDLNAIKRGKSELDGSSYKLTINEKGIDIGDNKSQKTILGGRSPDFGDTMMMRFYFYFMPEPKKMRQTN